MNVGELVRLPDGRTGRLVVLRDGMATVQLVSGVMHVLPVHKLKRVK